MDKKIPLPKRGSTLELEQVVPVSKKVAVVQSCGVLMLVIQLETY
jgi:hypothetical protein